MATKAVSQVGLYKVLMVTAILDEYNNFSNDTLQNIQRKRPLSDDTQESF
jgi:hypothetical protein